MSSKKHSRVVRQECAPELTNAESLNVRDHLSRAVCTEDAPNIKNDAHIDGELVPLLGPELDMLPGPTEPVAIRLKVASEEVFRETPADKIMGSVTMYFFVSDLLGCIQILTLWL